MFTLSYLDILGGQILGALLQNWLTVDIIKSIQHATDYRNDPYETYEAHIAGATFLAEAVGIYRPFSHDYIVRSEAS